VDTKILAIDDNLDNLTALKAIARDALPGCALMTALNGPQGIELARSGDPDMILLDIVMPGMDGFEVCRKLKADRHLRGIPVVFLTAIKTDRESRIKALDAGAEAFLSKPLDEQELVAQVRAMAKIKAANQFRRQEQERLADLVAGRTRELEWELAKRRRVEEKVRIQLDELQRWQDVMLGREDRVQELKREVNELCRRAGETARYPSQEAGPENSEAAKPDS
jgi:response regulator RpfG family c-di-GMP phosphodiesterase